MVVVIKENTVDDEIRITRSITDIVRTLCYLTNLSCANYDIRKKRKEFYELTGERDFSLYQG